MCSHDQGCADIVRISNNVNLVIIVYTMPLTGLRMCEVNETECGVAEYQPLQSSFVCTI